MAIGAGRRRLVRQVLTEGMLLTLAGGGAGVLLAYWAVPALREWLPATLPRGSEAAVNGPVLLVLAAAICMITGLAFAALPALAGISRRRDRDPQVRGRGTRRPGTRSRQLLAAGQVALATVLLVGAGLLVQSLQRLQRVELGFDPSGITTGMIGLPPDRYADSDASWLFYQRLLERVAAAPGVTAAALSSGAPFGGGNTGMPINAVGGSRLDGSALQTDWRMVSPDYFRAMRIPLLRGANFRGDASDDEPAHRLGGDGPPHLGRRRSGRPPDQGGTERRLHRDRRRRGRTQSRSVDRPGADHVPPGLAIHLADDDGDRARE